MLKKIDHILVIEGLKKGCYYGYVIHNEKHNNKPFYYKEYFHDDPEVSICKRTGYIKSCEQCSYKVDSSICRHTLCGISEQDVKQFLKENITKKINNDIVIDKTK